MVAGRPILPKTDAGTYSLRCGMKAQDLAVRLSQ